MDILTSEYRKEGEKLPGSLPSGGSTKYTITVDSGKNGSVTADRKSARVPARELS